MSSVQSKTTCTLLRVHRLFLSAFCHAVLFRGMEREDPAHGAIQTHRFPTEAKRYRVAAPVIDGQRILRYLNIQGAFPVTDTEFHAFPRFGKAGIDPQGIFLDPYPAEAISANGLPSTLT